MKVGVVQFVKGAMATGEKAVLRCLPRPDANSSRWARASPGTRRIAARDIAVARAAWEEVKRMIADPSL
jgi:cob(I)alamin adenosyltransferase